MSEMHFLGHPVLYWIELQKRADDNRMDPNMLDEIVALQGKVAFYEYRIRQMAAVAK